MFHTGIEKGQKGLRWAAPRFRLGGGTINWGAAQETSKSSSPGEDVLIKLCT